MIRNTAIVVFATAAVVATRVMTIQLLCPPGSPGRIMFDSLYDWQETIGAAFGFPKVFPPFGMSCLRASVALIPYVLGGVGATLFLGGMLSPRFGRQVGMAAGWYTLWHTMMLCAGAGGLTILLVSTGRTQTFPEEDWADRTVDAMVQYGMMAIPMVWALMFQHVRAALGAYGGSVDAYLHAQPGWLARELAGAELAAVGLDQETSGAAAIEVQRTGPFVVR